MPLLYNFDVYLVMLPSFCQREERLAAKRRAENPDEAET